MKICFDERVTSFGWTGTVVYIGFWGRKKVLQEGRTPVGFFKGRTKENM